MIRAYFSCVFVSAIALLSACAGSEPRPVTPSAPTPSAVMIPPPAPMASAIPLPSTGAPASSPPTPALSPSIDEKVVASATGVESPEKSPDGTVKVTWPRKDVAVAVDSWKMPPFMGLTSWVAFSAGRKEVAEAMIMGDLVLFEDEVNPVMSKLLEGGVQVTALHNHFFFAQPNVLFMHIAGEGTTADLGKAVRAALDESAAIRKKVPKPGSSFGTAKLPEKSTIDGVKLDTAFDAKGQAKEGMYKAVWGREVTASCGCPAGKAMGVNTWAAFAGTDDNAVVDGDFAVAEEELQPVLKALRAGGINIVAIHHHMTREEPRILFLHYWGRGKAVDLAATVKKALDLTAWAGKAKAT